MSRLTLLFRTDVHVADKAPSSWKGNYLGEILDCLSQVGAIANEHKAKAVLDGGDFFHVKAATKNSHALVEKVSQIHQRYPCPVWCVEGNHDITSNDLESVTRQPLGVLYATKVFNHLRDETFEEHGIRVRVVGVPYSPVRTLDEIHELTRRRPEDQYVVAVVHALATENPPAKVEEFFGEPVFKYSDLIWDDGPQVFCFGHWHKDQGIHKQRKVTFVNQGALSRGALVKENLERSPKVALLEFTDKTITVTTKNLNVLPASEVFDLERKERQEKENDEIVRCVEKLRDELSHNVNTEMSLNALIDNVPCEVAVRDKVRYYLELARQGK